MSLFAEYAARLQDVLAAQSWDMVTRLAEDMLGVWRQDRQVFLCGNGGSAANAVHLANDLVYGAAPGAAKGLKVHALSANPSVITCIANDEGYEHVFSYQLAVLGNPDDLLLVFSGSGNSTNIVRAVEQARTSGIRTAGVVGFDGGAVLPLLDVPIHFAVDDMQIAEDCQQVVGHMVMKYLQEAGYGRSCRS